VRTNARVRPSGDISGRVSASILRRRVSEGPGFAGFERHELEPVRLARRRARRLGKLSPDGSQVIWWTLLAGSQNDNATALTLGLDSSVYVTGTTSSPDFPTTSGSMEPTASVSGQAFAVKLTSAGAVTYATYIGGTDPTTGNAIAVDSLGHAFITGTLGLGGIFPTTAGAVTGATSTSYGTAYVLELDPMGSKALVAISGFGGYAIALDAQGNIYAAGAFLGPENNGPGNTFSAAPTTAGAFQTISFPNTCLGEGLFFKAPCNYQHVAKIDPTGTHLIYGTYVFCGSRDY
jgi:hypothetical protein